MNDQINELTRCELITELDRGHKASSTDGLRRHALKVIDFVKLVSDCYVESHRLLIIMQIFASLHREHMNDNQRKTNQRVFDS